MASVFPFLEACFYLFLSEGSVVISILLIPPAPRPRNASMGPKSRTPRLPPLNLCSGARVRSIASGISTRGPEQTRRRRRRSGRRIPRASQGQGRDPVARRADSSRLHGEREDGVYSVRFFFVKVNLSNLKEGRFRLITFPSGLSVRPRPTLRGQTVSLNRPLSCFFLVVDCARLADPDPTLGKQRGWAVSAQTGRPSFPGQVSRSRAARPATRAETERGPFRRGLWGKAGEGAALWARARARAEPHRPVYRRGESFPVGAQPARRGAPGLGPRC